MNLSLLVTCALAAAATFAPTIAQAKGRNVPGGVTLKGLEGGNVKSKDLRSQKVVLQFFASWCQGCGTVMSELDPLVKEIDGVRFIPVSVDESMEDAKDFFKRQGAVVRALKKRAYFDPQAELAGGLVVESLPALVVLERGRVVMQLNGHPTSKQYEKLKAVLAD